MYYLELQRYLKEKQNNNIYYVTNTTYLHTYIIYMCVMYTYTCIFIDIIHIMYMQYVILYIKDMLNIL